jgi:hypothetical protein
LNIDPAAISRNAARMTPTVPISVHGFGLVEGRDRTVR